MEQPSNARCRASVSGWIRESLNFQSRVQWTNGAAKPSQVGGLGRASTQRRFSGSRLPVGSAAWELAGPPPGRPPATPPSPARPQRAPARVGLCLAANLLQVEQLLDVRMSIDVVAAADAPQFEAEPFGQVLQICEADVLDRAAGEPCEEFAPIHVPTVAVAWDGSISGRTDPRIVAAAVAGRSPATRRRRLHAPTVTSKEPWPKLAQRAALARHA